MIETHGLTHISLPVADPERSLQFYQQLLGVREYHRDANGIQALGPGPFDVIAFDKSNSTPEQTSGLHFGFRLKHAADIKQAITCAQQINATILRSGEFAPGCPYVYLQDPDGYTIEIWYE